MNTIVILVLTVTIALSNGQTKENEYQVTKPGLTLEECERKIEEMKGENQFEPPYIFKSAHCKEVTE